MICPKCYGSKWYSIGVEPSVYQSFDYCFCLLISCQYCHCKIGKSIHHKGDIFLSIFSMAHFCKIQTIINPCFVFLDLYTDPWSCNISYMIWPNWSHLDILCSRRSILSWKLMYALFSGGHPPHGAVAALGPYKLLAIPTGDCLIYFLYFSLRHCVHKKVVTLQSYMSLKYCV